MTATVPAPTDATGLVAERFERTISAGEAFFTGHARAIAECASAMADRFFEGGRLLVFGGGSGTTDAQHNSVEYVHPVLPVRALPALSLTNDGATVTGILLGDDPNAVFEHQVRVLGSKGDIALAFADVPPAPAIARGLAAAREMGMLTVSLLNAPAPPEPFTDHQFGAGSDDHMVVQELQLAVYHMLWELVHIVLNHRGIPEAAGNGRAP